MAITHLGIEVALKNRYHLVGTKKVHEQHILVKCCKCSHFGVTSNLLQVATSTITNVVVISNLRSCRKNGLSGAFLGSRADLEGQA